MSAQAAVQLDILEAIRQRDAGMARVLYHSDADYRDALMRAIKSLAAIAERRFTADDLRDIAGEPPAGTHFNVIGAVFSKAAAEGMIRHVGYAHSKRVQGHHNLLRVWVGA